jgi:multiple sugar transport system permease protein
LKKNGYARANRIFGLAATAPALLVLLALFVYPLAFSAFVGMTDYTVANVLSGRGVSFTGFANYRALLQDAQFQNATKVTLVIAIAAVAMEFTIGIALSASVSRMRRLRGLTTTLFMMTIMIAPVVVSLLFKFLLGDELGVLNGILKAAGLIRSDILWLTSGNLARASMVMIDTWQATSTIFLLVYTAIISIPQDVLESARVDGAGVFQTFFRIILPMVRSVIAYAMVIRFMDAFRIFDSAYLVTNGGPAGATETLSLFIYRKSWTQMDISSASAASFLMMAMMAAGMLLIRRFVGEGRRER